MASEIDSLQQRVDAIWATGDAELAGLVWHALSKILFDFTSEKRGVRHFPIIKRVNAADAERLLIEMSDQNSTLKN